MHTIYEDLHIFQYGNVLGEFSTRQAQDITPIQRSLAPDNSHWRSSLRSEVIL